jgi:hypothetical protein
VTTIILAGIVVFVTHALEAITGFGCTVLALPFITALFGMKPGIETLTILAWILALYIVITKWKNIDWKNFVVIIVFVLAGLPIGMYLFKYVDPAPLKRILAIFIIFASGSQLVAFWLSYREAKLGSKLALPRSLAKAANYVLLFLGGIVHGMFSSGGPLVVLYASKAIPDKGKFRATLCLVWATLNSIIIGSYFVNATLTAEDMTRTLYMVPFLIFGIVAGEWAHKKVKADSFKLIVFALLLITGVIMCFY